MSECRIFRKVQVYTKKFFVPEYIDISIEYYF